MKVVKRNYVYPQGGGNKALLPPVVQLNQQKVIDQKQAAQLDKDELKNFIVVDAQKLQINTPEDTLPNWVTFASSSSTVSSSSFSSSSSSFSSSSSSSSFSSSSSSFSSSSSRSSSSSSSSSRSSSSSSSSSGFQSQFSVSFVEGSSQRGVADQAGLAVTSNLTISLWVKPTFVVTGSTDRSFIHRWDGSVGYSLQLAAGRLLGAINGVGAGGSTLFVQDTWYHAALTYDGSTLRIYLDGVEEDNSPAVALGDAGVDMVAAGRSDSAEYTSCILDEILIINDALTAPQIAQLAAGNLHPSSLSNKVAWWRFEEGSGSTAADSSGNGNTLTLENSPTWVADVPPNLA